MLGLLLAGALGWSAWELYKSVSRDALSGLQIAEGPLTIDAKQPYIDQLAAGYLSRKDNVGLVVGVIEDGQRRVFGYGSVARGSDRVPDGDTVFELASVGKTFTTSVLAEMHERGELSWHDPLQRFLPPEVSMPRQGKREITLLDLATQSSGLPNLPAGVRANWLDENPYADYSVEQMYEDLTQVRLKGRIGRRYAYSNFGMGLLGHALERHAGVPYEQLVISRLCEPLQMTATRMTLDDAARERLATPHAWGEPVGVWEDVTMPGAGSFLSTANDMLSFIEAHWVDEDTALHRALRACTRKQRIRETLWMSIGLAWNIDSENAIDVVWHNGASAGSCSFAAMLIPQRLGVVVLSNSSASVDELGLTVLYLLHLH